MGKQKLRIPVVVTKSGAIQTGVFWRHGDGKTGSDHDFCYDGFSESDYRSGCTIVHVEAEVDIDAVFKHYEITGDVAAT